MTIKGQNHYCIKDWTEIFIALCAPVDESLTFKSEWHVCGLLAWRRHSNFVNFLYKVYEVIVFQPHPIMKMLNKEDAAV